MISFLLKKFPTLILVFCAFQAYSQEYTLKTEPLKDEKGFYSQGQSVLIDSDNFLWYSSKNGLVKQAGRHKVFYRYNNPDIKEETSMFILEKANPDVIIGVNLSYFIRFDKRKGVVELLYTIEDDVKVYGNSLKRDIYGNLWAIAGKKTFVCYTKENEFKVYNIEDFSNKEIDLTDFSLEHVQENNHFILKKDQTYYEYNYHELNKLVGFKKEGAHYNYFSSNGSLFPKNSSGKFTIEGKEYSYTYLPEKELQVYQFPYKQYKVVNVKGTQVIIVYSNLVLKLFEFNDGGYFIKKEFTLKDTAYDIKVVSKRKILISDINGITMIEQKDIDFKNIPFEYDINKLEPAVGFRTIVKAYKGNLYALAYNGLFILEKGTDTYKEIIFSDEKTGRTIDKTRNIYGFYKLNDDTLLAYGGEDLYYLNLKTLTYTKTIFNYDKDLKYKGISDAEYLTKDTLLLSGFFGLKKYNWKTFKTVDYSQLNDTLSVKNKLVETVYYDHSKKELWLGLINNGGLFKKNLTSGEVIHFKKGNDRYPLVDNNVMIIEPSVKENVLWIGTQNGLQKINTDNLEGEVYNFVEGANNSAVGIIEHDKNLWVSTDDGLILLNLNTGIKSIFHETNGLPNNEFDRKSYARISKDSLFFGGVKGVIKLNPTKFYQNPKEVQVLLIEASYYSKEEEKKVKVTTNLKNVKTFKIPFQYNYLNLKLAMNTLLEYETNQFYYKIGEFKKDWLGVGAYGEINIQGLPPGEYLLEVKGVNKSGNSSQILKYDLIIEQVFYKQTWFTLSIVFIVVVLVFSYYISRKNNHKQEIKFHLSQTDALRANMNPHMLFNALNAIQSTMLLEGEEAANDYIVKYSEFIRNTLDINLAESVILKDKIKYINSYLELEKLMLNNNLEYSLEVDSLLDIENLILPTLFIQPLIENAIMHGLVNKPNNRKLQVKFKKVSKNLIIEIIDNGIGRAASEALKKTHNKTNKSHGTNIMKERIKHLNSLNKRKIVFTIIDVLSNNKIVGTKAVLQIPLKTTNKK